MKIATTATATATTKNAATKNENSVNTSVSLLLDAADYCNDALLAVQEVQSLLKENFSSSTVASRKIITILQLLSKTLPMISKPVKSRASKCSPTKSNPSYAQATRLRTVSPTGSLTGVAKLQSLFQPIPTTRQSRRVVKKKSEKHLVPPDDFPIPLNGKRFLIKEAAVAFKYFPHKDKRYQLFSYWHEQGRAPQYTIRSWRRICIGRMDIKGEAATRVDRCTEMSWRY